MALAFWYGGQLLARRELSAYEYFVVFIAVVAGGEAAGEFFASTNSTYSPFMFNRIIFSSNAFLFSLFCSTPFQVHKSRARDIFQGA